MKITKTQSRRYIESLARKSQIDLNDIFVISFASEPTWHMARLRLTKTFHKYLPKVNLKIYSQNDLKKIVNIETLDFMQKSHFAFGYYLWKPIIFYEEITKISDQKILIWIDCGSELNFKTTESIDKFFNYIMDAKKQNALGFELPFKNAEYTTEYTLSKFPEKFTALNQIMATIFVINVNEVTRNFASEWFDWAHRDNFSYLLGGVSENKLLSIPKNHRFDQSLMSLLWQKYRFGQIPDETYFDPDWRKGECYPFWAARNRYKVSVASNKLLYLWARLNRAIYIKSITVFIK
jgi:hypothetical protein